MAYGTFVNKLLSFLGVGLVLYGLASLYDWLSKDSIIKRTAKCRYCRKRISEKVSFFLLRFVLFLRLKGLCL